MKLKDPIAELTKNERHIGRGNTYSIRLKNSNEPEKKPDLPQKKPIRKSSIWDLVGL